MGPPRDRRDFLTTLIAGADLLLPGRFLASRNPFHFIEGWAVR